MERKRYSDSELQEFRAIIEEKLAIAERDYKDLMKQLRNGDSNGDNDTAPRYSEDDNGALMQSRYEIANSAQRQQKFINGLKAALVRIENKTYGIDRITGELIPKDRLRIVPHATLSVQSKNSRKQ